MRTVFTFGMAMGGPQAYWATYCSSSVLILITAAVLAETCSALPAAGSIYFWAAASGGPRFGRLFGFVVAWWSTTAWISFVASSAQVCANFLFSEAAVFGLSWNTDTSNVRFRAVQWIVSEAILLVCFAINYMPPKLYRWVFRVGILIVFVDFFLNIIWLPIGVSKTYGFQDADWVFTKFENMTGGPDAWAWMLCYFATGGVQIGFDASGHVAEETKSASSVAAKGLFWSAVTSVAMACPIAILLLFCSPSLDQLFGLTAPQPFVEIYALALGQRAHIAATVISVFSVLASATVSIVAASRLVYAIARDGVLPFSSWIGRINPKTHQPQNAVTTMYIVAAVLLCSILPSSMAFQSLVSCAAVPTVSAWGLISFGRLFLSDLTQHKPKFNLGILSKPFLVISLLWNTFLAGVLFSPQEFPVTSQNFNYAPVVMGIVTIFALLCYFIIPEDKWLRNLPTGKEPDAASASSTEWT